VVSTKPEVEVALGSPVDEIVARHPLVEVPAVQYVVEGKF
jgi:hypothetical protein